MMATALFVAVVTAAAWASARRSGQSLGATPDGSLTDRDVTVLRSLVWERARTSRTPSTCKPLAVALSEAERSAVECAIAGGGTVTDAARLLGVTGAKIHHLLRTHKISHAFGQKIRRTTPDRLTRAEMLRALEEHGGNKEAAAAALGIGRETLRSRLLSTAQEWRGARKARGSQYDPETLRAAVAQHGSVRAAAAALRIPPSTVHDILRKAAPPPRLDVLARELPEGSRLVLQQLEHRGYVARNEEGAWYLLPAGEEALPAAVPQDVVDAAAISRTAAEQEAWEEQQGLVARRRFDEDLARARSSTVTLHGGSRGAVEFVPLRAAKLSAAHLNAARAAKATHLWTAGGPGPAPGWLLTAAREAGYAVSTIGSAKALTEAGGPKALARRMAGWRRLRMQEAAGATWRETHRRLQVAAGAKGVAPQTTGRRDLEFDEDDTAAPAQAPRKAAKRLLELDGLTD